MKSDTSKIQLVVSNERICISDRMPIRLFEIASFLTFISVVAIACLGLVGIVYSLIFSAGYGLFRYFSWVFWRKLEIDLVDRKLTVTQMCLNRIRSSKELTKKFDFANLELLEFEQRRVARAMIQYKTHQVHDLLLLTHHGDIEMIKNELIKGNTLKQVAH